MPSSSGYSQPRDWAWVSCPSGRFLPSEPPGKPVVKNLPASAGDKGLIGGLGRSPGEGNGNPLYYSCLGNPTDREFWWATVHGVTKSGTWLCNQTTTTTWKDMFKVNPLGKWRLWFWPKPARPKPTCTLCHPKSLTDWSARTEHTTMRTGGCHGLNGHVLTQVRYGTERFESRCRNQSSAQDADSYSPRALNGVKTHGVHKPPHSHL